MVPASRDWHVLNRLLHHASDEGLHGHVFQCGLHSELPVNILGQINVNLPAPDARFSHSSHDSLYFCTKRYQISTAPGTGARRTKSRVRFGTPMQSGPASLARNPRSEVAPALRFSRCALTGTRGESPADHSAQERATVLATAGLALANSSIFRRTFVE